MKGDWRTWWYRPVPQNVCRGGVACTLNTRYEDAAVRDYVDLRHFPKTAVMSVYENDNAERDDGWSLQVAGDEVFQQGELALPPMLHVQEHLGDDGI